MPLFAYKCECGSVIKKFMRTASNVPSSFICADCNSVMKRLLSAPASTSKITVDNGVQARQVEIHPEIVEINEERSNKNLREED